MVGLRSTAALGSAMFGLANAAGAGTKAQYASGEVHHRIMGIKMVCLGEHYSYPNGR